MTQRRKHTRFSIEIPVKCKILDRHKKKEISHEIISATCNLSEGGVCLNWPTSWSCESCTNCLAWIFNHSCILKEEASLGESNKHLTPSTFVQIQLDSPLIDSSIKLATRVAWVKPEEGKDLYGIGLSFLKYEEDKLKELQEKISILKEKKSF